MAELILASFAIYTVVFLVGWPWALWLSSVSGGAKCPVWLISPLIGQLIIGVGWIWGFGFAGGLVTATIFSLSLSMFGWFVSQASRRSRQSKSASLNFKVYRIVQILIVIFMVLILASRSQPSVHQTSYPTRIGPDLVAYTVSARIIVKDGTFSNLQSRIELENSSTLSELFSLSSNRNVYSIPSFPDQAAAEILLGALRWGVVGLIAELQFIGLTSNIFGLTNALSLLNIFFALAVLLNKSTRPTRTFSLQLFGSAIFLSSPSIVVAYLDGFVAQTIALPYIVLTCVGLISLFDTNHKFSVSSPILFLLGLAGLSVFYFDGLMLFGPVVVMTLVIGRRQFATCVSRVDKVDKITLLTISGLFLVGLIPLLLNIPQWLIKRFAESKTNGYWQPSWISIIELLGLTTKDWNVSGAWNAVSGHSISLQKQSVLWLISVPLLFLILRSVKKDHKIVLSAFLIILFLVFVMDTYLNLSNFRFFKVMSYGFPVIWICFFEFYQEFANRNSISGSAIRAFSRCLTLLLLLQLWVQIKPDTETTNPPYYLVEIMKDARSARAQQILVTSNVIGPANHVLMGSIAASSELFWMDRGFGGVSTNFDNRKHLPLYWAVFKDSDRPFQCLIDAIGVRAGDFVTTDFALLRLSDETVKQSNVYLEDFLKLYSGGIDFVRCDQTALTSSNNSSL